MDGNYSDLPVKRLKNEGGEKPKFVVDEIIFEKYEDMMCYIKFKNAKSIKDEFTLAKPPKINTQEEKYRKDSRIDVSDKVLNELLKTSDILINVKQMNLVSLEEKKKEEHFVVFKEQMKFFDDCFCKQKKEFKELDENYLQKQTEIKKQGELEIKMETELLDTKISSIRKEMNENKELIEISNKRDSTGKKILELQKLLGT